MVGDLFRFWNEVFSLTWEYFAEYRKAIIISTVVLVIGDLLAYYFYDRATASEWSWSNAMTQVFPFTLLAVGMSVVFFLAVAPFLLNKKTSERLRISEDEKYALREKLTPVISVLYENDKKAPYYHTDERERFKLLRIGIKNEGYTYLEGVRVKLMGVKQLKDGTTKPLFNGQLPATLHLKGDNPPDGSMKEFLNEFSINARSTEYIDVVQWVYTTTISDLPWVQFMWAEQPHPLNGPFGHYEYELDIEVTARGGDKVSRKYRTGINPFRLEEVSE